MRETIVLTGGARSGKSRYAESLAGELGGNSVLYIATAAVCDEEMADRVSKHRAQRPTEWVTLEQFWNFHTLSENRDFLKAEVVLLDCLGFMLNNIMYHSGIDWEHCPVSDGERVEARMLSEVTALQKAAVDFEKTLIIVTNEVGMGLVPADPVSRTYRDILGRANGAFCEMAQCVYLMVSHIPLLIKGERP